MTTDEFTKLYAFMNRKFDFIEANMATKENVYRIYTVMDGLAKRVHDDDQERAAMAAQLDRHDDWINKLATKTNTSLR